MAMQFSGPLRHRPVDLGRRRLCDALEEVMGIQPGSVQRINTPTRRDVLKATMGVMIATLWGGSPAYAEEESMTTTAKSYALPSVLTYEDVRAVSPALEHYTKGVLFDGLCQRPELSPRDRSIVTVAALIARIQTIEMPYHFALALDNGVKPSELSEIITHPAFYSGCANAMSAVAVAKDIFHQREIGINQLPPAKDKLLPLNEDAERQRATQVSANFEPVDGPINDDIDEACREKYKNSPYLQPMISGRSRSATVKIQPYGELQDGR